MREALALVGEEGLEAMWARHQKLHEDLWKGLGELGLEPFVQNPDDRLCTVNTVKVCYHTYPQFDCLRLEHHAFSAERSLLAVLRRSSATKLLSLL